MRFIAGEVEAFTWHPTFRAAKLTAETLEDAARELKTKLLSLGALTVRGHKAERGFAFLLLANFANSPATWWCVQKDKPSYHKGNGLNVHYI